MLFFKTLGFVFGAFVLGVIGTALIPVLAVFGVGALMMFIIYAMITASKMDVNAEVEALKEKRKREQSAKFRD